MTSPDYFSQISYLMIEPNSACNLKCTFCNRERLVKEGQRRKKTLSPEEYRGLLRLFQNCPIDTIKIEGLSEPMFHKEFDQIASITREMFPRAFVIIATNLCYDVTRTAFFKTISNVDMIYLSIDGVDKVFEEHRIGATFDRFIRSLDQIKNHTTLEERQKMHLNFTATEFNYQCLPEVYRICSAYELGGVRINLAQNWNEDELNDHDYNLDFIKMMKCYVQDVKGVGGWDYKDCFWPFSGIVVDVFGNVRQCIINTGQKPIGNVFREDIRDIYNKSQHYMMTRKKLARNCAPESCKTCDYKRLSPILEHIFKGKGIRSEPRVFKRL